MKTILSVLSLGLWRKPKPTPLELHRLPWHPMFYLAVKMHIDDTTPHRRF